MSATIQRGSDALEVTGVVNFATVIALRAEGERHISAAKTAKQVIFDLAQIQCTDSSVLPLLTAWLRVGKQQGVVVLFRQMPVVLERITKVCGMLPFIKHDG